MRRFVMCVSVVVAGVALLLGASAASAADSARSNWVITDPGTRGDRSSAAVAINDSGQIVGWRQPRNSYPRAFLWHNGKTIDLGTLGGDGSSASAINERGQIIGNSWTSDTEFGVQVGHAFLWQNGKMTDLGTLLGGEGTAFARAINDRGQIVGTSRAGYDANGVVEHAFLWQNGHMRDLGTLPHDGWSEAVAINNRGQVVGFSHCPKSDHAFLWQNGKMTDLGRPTTSAIAINDSGQVALNTGGHAVVWEKGRTRALSGRESSVLAINDRGQPIGTYLQTRVPGSSQYHACLWQNGRLIDLTPTGKPYTPVAINERGQVIGATNAGTKRPGAFVWQAGHAVELGTRGHGGITVNAINNRGQIVGHSGSSTTGQEHALLWTLRP